MSTEGGLPGEQPASGAALRAFGRRGLRVGKYVFGHSAWSLPLLLRLTPEGTERAIRDDTELVVEGFPRSGNTFTAFAIRYLSESPIRIATHVHHPGSIKLAVRRKLPVLVVIRPPVEALASYLIAGPHGTPWMVYREYRYYHREIAKFGPEVMLATFEQVTGDFPMVVRRLNEVFGLALPVRPLGDRDREAIFGMIDQHSQTHHPGHGGIVPRPDPGRDHTNEQLRSELGSPKYAQIRADCERLYEELTLRTVIS